MPANLPAPLAEAYRFAQAQYQAAQESRQARAGQCMADDLRLGAFEEQARQTLNEMIRVARATQGIPVATERVVLPWWQPDWGRHE